jgi:phospholipid/cholesterol/gamma-HCH transport system substrate-binding protein
MGPYKRNWFVGGTVLLALITLGFLIIIFGGSLGSLFAGEKFAVTFRADRGDGISEGSSVRYLGQRVGTVKAVDLVLDQTPNYVLIHTEIDKNRSLPGNVQGSIRVPNLLGASAVIELEIDPNADPARKLVGGEILSTRYVGSGLIPPEISQLATEMKEAVRDFRDANLVGDFKTALQNFNTQVSKAGNVMASIDAIIGSEQGQADLKTAIANFRQATEHAKTTLANAQRISEDLKTLPEKIDATIGNVNGGVDDAKLRIVQVSEQLNANLAKVSAVLDEARQITQKVNTGKGTAALLLNDPKLYEKLVIGTEVINATVLDIQRVIRGFEEDGVPLKLK